MLIDESGKVLSAFRSELHEAGFALHCGTKRSNPAFSTMAMEETWFPKHWRHVGTDIESGEDVSFVADLQTCNEWPYRFDAIVCCSVLEHIERPWLVPYVLRSACNRGASLYVQTHQTFPIHGFPQDFYRFSAEALRSLFCRDHGWNPLQCEYEFPCTITSEVKGQAWKARSPSYLNVSLFARAI